MYPTAAPRYKQLYMNVRMYVYWLVFKPHAISWGDVSVSCCPRARKFATVVLGRKGKEWRVCVFSVCNAVNCLPRRGVLARFSGVRAGDTGGVGYHNAEFQRQQEGVSPICYHRRR